MKKVLLFVVMVLLFWIIPQGCSSDDKVTTPEKVVIDDDTEDPVEEDEPKALFNLFIVDAPGDYISVYVEVLGVNIIVDNDTIPLDLIWANADQPGVEKLDLLEYTGGGYDVLIGEHAVPAGELSEIILVLGNENRVITADGRTNSLTLTDDTKNGISIPFNYSFQEGELATLTIDFDVDASLSKVEGASREFILDPQIRGFDNNSTGHIYGYLASGLGANPARLTVEAGDITYSTQTYDNEFMLWGLPPGNHDLTFSFSEASGIDDLVVNDIEVVAGENTSIGPLDH
ncbi:DUF4382 domain-containing protein [Salinimicrobium flavum]|uniref:DUF4382 domain-containing protein n=1 Tax=Salinimicrobium flavum TaxID=1737065 RepID=A0ABW5IVS9_9FLAO